jgi:hypothetical protein
MIYSSKSHKASFNGSALKYSVKPWKTKNTGSKIKKTGFDLKKEMMLRIPVCVK